jgi:tRNA pseudouridine55 synthase
MDGVLVIDKPAGLTSHDVVALARRELGVSKIGHTGTLDPLATGVLPLAIGRATRLVRFLTASDKDYDALIRFGLTTDTYDVTGQEVTRTGAAPILSDATRALRSLTGEYLQTPPAYSAKKVGGRRAYRLARADNAVALKPVPVRVSRAELIGFDGVTARVVLTCSAGFYVRSFAHALGELAGTGACLEGLRRTRSGEFGLDRAVGVEQLADAARVASALVPMPQLLSYLPAVTLTEQGLKLVSHGRDLEPADYAAVATVPQSRGQSQEALSPVPERSWVRLLDMSGALVGMATAGSRQGFLHPSLVLM